MNYQLAQVNVAQLVAGADDPRMRGLFSRVEEMNRLADRTEGFVWRLPGGEVTAEDLRAVADYLGDGEPERIFYNMSTWESPDHLRAYVYRSQHKEMLQAKHSWIEASNPKINRAPMALWWIRTNHKPTIAESVEKLWAVSLNGPTEIAFTLSQTFPPPAVTVL